MTMRYIKAKYIPRVQKPNSRGELMWTYDYDLAKDIRVGISADRVSRAEVRGDVEIEVYNARLPANLAGLGPGGRLVWDGSEWDFAAPPLHRNSRTHSVRHVTVQIRRRPYTEGGRD